MGRTNARSKDLYSILGVSRDAGPSAIKAAYRAKVKLTHPDAGGSSQAFSEVLQAYEVLRDEQARRIYDETGEFTSSQAVVNGAEAIIESLLNPLISRPDVLDLDILQIMNSEIDTRLKVKRANISVLRMSERALTSLRQRIKRKVGVAEKDLLAELLDRKRESIAKAIDLEDTGIAQLKLAAQMLEAYTSEPSTPPNVDLSAFGPLDDPLIKTAEGGR